ncbi:MAG: phosphoribosylaminoimidazolesuccinocarboxamide synthase [Ignavibacteria bacterium]|nr:phosphoribosylaminoimidazolesuccinocarboxamide synthase [Ignavibacteria bacterium]
MSHNYSIDLKKVKSGKVRDIYEYKNLLLIVASDRISAFDLIMNEPISGKGELLTKISAHWFNCTRHIINNHLIEADFEKFPVELQKYRPELEGRSMLVKKCNVLPVECIVRGYIVGSGWKEYKKSQSVCQIPLPAGLLEFQKLPTPIFTPSTKAEAGHDENISFEQMKSIIGSELAEKIKNISIEIYNFGAKKLEEKGILLADTKFEFGIDESNELLIIDEMLTPDSSRFWLKKYYAPGKEQVNFDKQILRDYLESINWNKKPPPPSLPQEIILKTYEKYKEAFDRIVSK